MKRHHFIGMIVSAILIYPLSIGPASWLLVHGMLPSGIFEIIYKPLTGPNLRIVDVYRSMWDGNEYLF